MLPKRKDDHIRISLKEDVQSRQPNGLDRFRLHPAPLPEISLEDVDLSHSVFGKRLNAPLLISSMTGGTKEAEAINRRLAETAQHCGIAMGLGSQRAMIEHPELTHTYQVRKFAPDILLFANIGAVQLNYGITTADCQKIVDSVEADALILHFNPLQEAIQPEGNTNFRTLLPKIEKLCSTLSVPVIAKEVGSGIDWIAAEKLIKVGIQAIDIAGTGGTSWALVEMYREKDPSRKHIAAAFANWGLPATECLINLRKHHREFPIFASGGVRDGIDTVKYLALGADLVGMTIPFLQAAIHSSEACVQVTEEIIETIRIASFLTGSANIQDLQKSGIIENIS